jgi:hypothetical protein
MEIGWLQSCGSIIVPTKIVITESVDLFSKDCPESGTGQRTGDLIQCEPMELRKNGLTTRG